MCSFDFKKKVQAKKKKSYARSSFLTFTYVYTFNVRDFICFTAFHRRDVCDGEDFLCLGERGETVSRRETPSQCRRANSPGGLLENAFQTECNHAEQLQ